MYATEFQNKYSIHKDQLSVYTATLAVLNQLWFTGYMSQTGTTDPL